MLDDLVKIYDNFAKGGRTMDLAKFAEDYDFQYSERQAFGNQPTAIKGFKIFNRKGSKRIIGVLEKSIEEYNGTIRFYDFLVTKDLETFTSSIVEIHCPDLYSNYFFIKPKSSIKKMSLFGFGKKNLFPELRDFHKKFKLENTDEGHDDLLNTSALELFTHFPKLRTEGRGHYFIFYRRNKELGIIDIPEILALGIDFVKFLKEGPASNQADFFV